MKCLIALSGGLDSTTLAGYLLNKGTEVEAISFYYGSKHNALENIAAQRVADYYGINLNRLDISQAMAGIESALMQTGGPIPEGRYDAEVMRQTVVPGRNMIFASILAGIAESRKIPAIGLGVHAGDHHIYPDCRPVFIHSMATSICHGTGGKVKEIMAPFLYLSKGEIIALSGSIKMPIPYSLTRTCYTSDAIACGKCGSCDERKEAFFENNMIDAIPYQE